MLSAANMLALQKISTKSCFFGSTCIYNTRSARGLSFFSDPASVRELIIEAGVFSIILT